MGRMCSKGLGGRTAAHEVGEEEGVKGYKGWAGLARNKRDRKCTQVQTKLTKKVGGEEARWTEQRQQVTK